MIPSKISKLILRYLIFVGIPYILARKLEKFFWKNIGEETKIKISNELTKSNNSVDDSTGKALDRKGGAIDPITISIIKLIMVDLSIKVAIGGAFASSIWSESADKAVENIARYSSAILAAPGRKLGRIVKRLKGINPDHTEDIKEILLDKNLTLEEKMEFLKLKIDYALKNLKGKKRKQFILLLVAILTFFYGNNIVGFTWLWERIRGFIGREDDAETIKEYIISIYHEYKAPLPKDLVVKISDEL